MRESRSYGSVRGEVSDGLPYRDLGSPPSMIKFGFNGSDVDAVAAQLAGHLQIAFESRYSDFRGGDYCRSETPAGTVLVQQNRDLDDPEPFESDWPINGVVVYLDGVDDRAWEQIVNQIRMASSELGATELLAPHKP